jgi:uncharacterized damage-inducible protein DinB
VRPTDLDDLVEKLESHRRELLRQVREMTEEEAGRRPSEQEWSVKEQLVHLATFERLWLEWAMKVRDEPGCEVGPPPPNPPAYADAATRPVADLVRELVSARSDTIAATQGLTEDELTRRGTSAVRRDERPADAALPVSARPNAHRSDGRARAIVQTRRLKRSEELACPRCRAGDP